MNQSSAWIPELVSQHGNRTVHRSCAFLMGLLALSFFAQISIPLPWTPVPITGQTLGVALISLLWGRMLGTTIVAAYLIAGFIGLPVFAQGRSGFAFGPSSGYLFGMLVASHVMGSLADLGWTRNFVKTWIATATGSLVTFIFGIFGLSFFLPNEQLLMAGLWPFLPGDVLKSLLVCWLVQKFQSKKRH